MSALLVRTSVLPGGPASPRYRAARTRLLADALAAAGLAGIDAGTLVRRCRTCGSADHGKPEVPAALAAGWHVSVAHTATRLAVAVADAPCGVDVEDVAAVGRAPVARVLLAPQEVRRGGHDDEALARVWVRKEALLKATGHGLAVEPSRVVLGPPGEPPVVRRWDLPGPPPGRATWFESVLPQAPRALVTAVALRPG